MQLVAVNGNLLSETYVLWDTIYFFNKENLPTVSGTATVSASGENVSISNSQQNTFILNDNNQLFIPTAGGIVVEFDLTFNSGSNGCYVSFTTASNTRGTTLQIPQTTTTDTYKAEWKNGVFTLYKNDVELNHTSDSLSVDNVGFCFTDYQTDLDIIIHEFKIYPA